LPNATKCEHRPEPHPDIRLSENQTERLNSPFVSRICERFGGFLPHRLWLGLIRYCSNESLRGLPAHGPDQTESASCCGAAMGISIVKRVLGVEFEPMRGWLTPPFRSGISLRRLLPGNRNCVSGMQDRPATKGAALPICPNPALIEVAFQPRKSESWAHADGNEIPSPAHAGGVRGHHSRHNEPFQGRIRVPARDCPYGNYGRSYASDLN
jgi:hypothetical protein